MTRTCFRCEQAIGKAPERCRSCVENVRARWPRQAHDEAVFIGRNAKPRPFDLPPNSRSGEIRRAWWNAATEQWEWWVAYSFWLPAVRPWDAHSAIVGEHQGTHDHAWPAQRMVAHDDVRGFVFDAIDCWLYELTGNA